MKGKKTGGRSFEKGNRYAKLGGQKTSRNTDHMKRIGSKGGKARADAYAALYADRVIDVLKG